MEIFLLVANKSEGVSGEPVEAYQVAMRRLKSKTWGMYANTPHRKVVSVNDKVVIYVAGSGYLGKHFIASADIVKVVEGKNVKNDLWLETPQVATLELGCIKYFDVPVSIKEVKDCLDFIPKNTSKWGCVLQRGLKRIKQSDFNTIIRFSNKACR